MIRIYPYPFSKHVKSLPDPPPPKSREIKRFECKKYENDYSWLLEAKNNLRKCFHLCNSCSKKFNYMRCLVKNSNVYYEYNLNNKILKNKLKEDTQHKENNYDINLHEYNKSTSHNNNLYNVKNNVLKINSNKSKNNMYNNQNIENTKAIKNNSIIFSNSLNNNENESLSFNDDVYIFLDDYSKKESKSYKRDEENYINKNSEDMIIYIKRHFKNNISYFACEHIKLNDLCNLNDEDNNYDNINIYMYDNDKEDFMHNCLINFSEENELYSLPQPCVINGVDEDEKEPSKEQTNMNISNAKFKNNFFLKINDLKGRNSENNINDITQIDENCEFINASNFLNNKKFNILSTVKEKTKMNDIVLQNDEDNRSSKKIYSLPQNDKKNNKLEYNTINKNMHFKNVKNYRKNSKNDSEIIFDDNIIDNINCSSKHKLLPLLKIDDDTKENVIYLDKKEFYFNDFLKEKQINEDCKSDKKNIIIPKDNIKGNKNHGIMANFDYDDGYYENRVNKNDNSKKNFEKYDVKKVNKSINLSKERNSLTLMDELNEKLIKRKNSHFAGNEEKNKNISCMLACNEKEKRTVSKSIEEELMINNRNLYKEVLKNNIASMKQNMNLTNIYKNNTKKNVTINNVNINEFKNKLINGVTSVSNVQRNRLKKSIVLDETKKSKENEKIKNCYNSEHKENISNKDTNYFKEGNNLNRNKSNEINTKKGNFKEAHNDINGDMGIQSYDIEVNSLTIDEKQKSSNIKLLKQIKRNNYLEQNERDEDKIKNDYLYFGQIEQIYEKKNIWNIVHNKILDINKEEKYKVKNKEYNQSKLIQNKEETIFNDSIKKNKYFTNKDSSNSNDIHKKNSNEIRMNKEDTIMKALNGMGSNDSNRIYINRSDNSNSDNKINDNSDIHKNSEDKSNFPKKYIFNSLIKNYESGLNNCENSRVKNELIEINCSGTKKHNYDFNVENLRISRKHENNSTNNWSNGTSMSFNKTKFSNNLKFNNNNDLIRKNKLDNHYLKNKIYFNQNKGVNTKYNGISNRSKESDKLKCCKNINNENFVSNYFIYDKKKEERKQQNIECEVNKIGCDERLNKKLKEKLGNILNLYTNPSKINIHNRIYTSDMEKNDLDNKKVVYINNNYFFNIDKDNYFENANGKFPENSMKYNFKKFNLQYCKNKNDFYSFKYMSNVLSSSCSLSKECILSESFESNILEEKFHKLSDLRNKYLLRKYLNKVLNKKKFQSISNIDKKISSINQRKLKYNMKKDICDENSKSENNFNTKKKFNEYLNIKQRINTNKCEAPKSPKKQDKIPKPSASQLEINSLSHLKKTPSYPFEEFLNIY
ncbi:conserved Plasmodium protein, unknown function [Plasmodium relictum]|uniref:Uncharacterized protein n=1 Tax=Plasmodium relictum TaxID=85471 RepID=A0A1J1H1N4_PLARL|nr:conserved Plasmodium protein, unknown function [Plasmodium relictum]CRG98478.1 conserved Plasmodium protein, unknown function [Plasmodium relictum]